VVDFYQQIEKDVVALNQSVGYDLIIIGGGPAGVSAAILASNRGLKVLLIEEVVICSNLYNIPCIEDFPYSDSYEITGAKLAEILMQQMEHHNIEIAYERVINLEILLNTNKKVVTQRHVYFAKSIILASGMQNSKVQYPGSERYYGRGLSYCASCDASSLFGKDAMITGGNEYAIKTALYLTNYVHKLYFVTEASNIYSTEKLNEKLLNNPKIECYFQHKLDDFYGDEFLEKVSVTSLVNNKTSNCDVSGLFVYHDVEGCVDYLQNNADFISDQIDNGFISTSSLMETAISGLYAIGAVRNHYFKRIISFSSEALIAVNEIQNYLYFQK